MNVAEVLRGQYEQNHSMLQGVMADVGQDLVNRTDGQGTVGSIGSIYAHVVFAEDTIMSSLRGEPSLYERGGWAQRLGIVMPGTRQTLDWAAGVRVDLPILGDYAKAVFEATEDYVGSLSPGGLDRVVQGVSGRSVPLLMLVANMGTIHIAQHAGEIAAIKGVRGMKGLPF